MTTADATTSLRYVSDQSPGIRRLAVTCGFRYVGLAGCALRDQRTLMRIRAMAVPPAWTDVWICPRADGHIQATGRDAKGRKQYRYHPDWHAARGDAKFGQLVAFGRALPDLRRRVDADLSRPGLPRDKVLAAVVELLDRTHLRVGNEEYARANGSYGLSTLRDKHARFVGDTVELRFRGKSGVFHTRGVSDRRLSAVVRACRDLPGQELFQYRGSDGRPVPIGSADVNGYIRQTSNGPFTAKVFRTWAGTVAAAVRLAAESADTKAARNKMVVRVVKEVAAELGNTPAVCRTSYIHPQVISAYLEGDFQLPKGRRRDGLSADETATLRFLSS